MRVQIPNIDSEHSVVRLRYVSQNPTENDRGMTFYQCADVKVTKSVQVTTEQEQARAPVPTRGGADCCAAKQFTMEGYETHSWRNPTAKKYYFDAANSLFRVDTNSGTGKFTLIMCVCSLIIIWHVEKFSLDFMPLIMY